VAGVLWRACGGQSLDDSSTTTARPIGMQKVKICIYQSKEYIFQFSGCHKNLALSCCHYSKNGIQECDIPVPDTKGGGYPPPKTPLDILMSCGWMDVF
jgi:hypothetical protein